MASKYRLKRPLVTALLLSVGFAFGLKFYQAFVHHALSADMMPETLGYIVGTAIPTAVFVFIPIAVVLLIWQGIAGMFDKTRK